MQSALVTGATGYVGSALTRHLVDVGTTVHVVVRPTSDLTRLPPEGDLLKIHRHDGTTEGMAEIVDSATPDVVFHLAAQYLREHEPSDLLPLIRSNIAFGSQLLEASRTVGPMFLVNTSSQFQHFDVDGYRPLNLYAATKQAFEDILAYYADLGDVAATTLVLSDVYGPADPRRRLLQAIRQAQLSGDQLSLPADDVAMSLVFIDDAVEAFMVAAGRLLTRTVGPVERFGVNATILHSIADVIEAFEAAAGAPVPHAWGAYPAPARAIQLPWRGATLPGWQPRVGLREGVERLIAGEL